MVDISVRGLRLHIPARYIESRAARGGGDQDLVPLFAALPDMRGYSDAEAALFAGNAADSPVVHLLIRADTNGLDAQTGWSASTCPTSSIPRAKPAPFGLTRYAFRADSGYGRDDLYVGNGRESAVAVRAPGPGPSQPQLPGDRPADRAGGQPVLSLQARPALALARASPTASIG